MRARPSVVMSSPIMCEHKIPSALIAFLIEYVFSNRRGISYLQSKYLLPLKDIHFEYHTKK